MNSRIRRSLYISFKSWLCCCSLPSVAPQQLLLLLLLLILLVTGPWSLGTDKKVYGCQPKETWVGHSVCLQSPHSLNLKVLYFVCWGVSVRWYWYMDDLETSFGMVLDHYIRPVHWQLSIRMYLHIGKQRMKTSLFSVTVSTLCSYPFSGTSIL